MLGEEIDNHISEGQSSENHSNEMDALQAVLAALKPLKPDVRKKLLKTVMTFFEIELYVSSSTRTESHYASPAGTEYNKTSPSFSEDRSMPPKEFILQKQPQTDVEKVACLAYYLTHYLDTPHFKTIDISKLNTEAAQIKFSNASKAIDNATNYGYLVPAVKGQKQLSAGGELFVQALPDRTAAREAMKSARPRKKNKNSFKKTSNHDKSKE